MRRLFILGLGLLMAIAPSRVVEPAERFAFENPDAGRLRPWTLPVGRLEGLLVVRLVAHRSENGGTAALETPLAGLGVLLALAPRTMLRFGLRLAYENPAELEVKPWVVPVARLLGACYLAVGLFAGRAGDAADEPHEENRTPRRG